LAQGYGLIVVMTPAELVNIVKVANDEQEDNG